MTDASGKFLGDLYVTPSPPAPGFELPPMKFEIGPAVANIHVIKRIQILENAMPSPEELAAQQTATPYDSAFAAQALLKAEQTAAVIKSVSGAQIIGPHAEPAMDAVPPAATIPPGLLATLENWFSYHPPKDDATRKQYEDIRAAGLVFAKAICTNAPACADRTSAIRHIRNAVFEANAAIACDGK